MAHSTPTFEYPGFAIVSRAVHRTGEPAPDLLGVELDAGVAKTRLAVAIASGHVLAGVVPCQITLNLPPQDPVELSVTKAPEINIAATDFYHAPRIDRDGPGLGAGC